MRTRYFFENDFRLLEVRRQERDPLAGGIHVWEPYKQSRLALREL